MAGQKQSDARQEFLRMALYYDSYTQGCCKTCILFFTASEVLPQTAILSAALVLYIIKHLSHEVIQKS